MDKSPYLELKALCASSPSLCQDFSELKIDPDLKSDQASITDFLEQTHEAGFDLINLVNDRSPTSALRLDALHEYNSEQDALN